MAYTTEYLYNLAEEAINKYKLIFIEDIIALLPCSKSTFYEHIPNESDNYKKLFKMLEANRAEMKVRMRKKWYDSGNATLQMGLYKLICSDEERRALSQQHIQTELTGKDGKELNFMTFLISTNPIDDKES